MWCRVRIVMCSIYICPASRTSARINMHRYATIRPYGKCKQYLPIAVISDTNNSVIWTYQGPSRQPSRQPESACFICACAYHMHDNDMCSVVRGVRGVRGRLYRRISLFIHIFALENCTYTSAVRLDSESVGCQIGKADSKLRRWASVHGSMDLVSKPGLGSVLGMRLSSPAVQDTLPTAQSLGEVMW
ncbi:hypothetical protein F4680DRAFT_76279 [Xylaria scruposa]|nr:hypothetical protein F4680DRAFT_76279 [Xylaria scruposa]